MVLKISDFGQKDSNGLRKKLFFECEVWTLGTLCMPQNICVNLLLTPGGQIDLDKSAARLKLYVATAEVVVCDGLLSKAGWSLEPTLPHQQPLMTHLSTKQTTSGSSFFDFHMDVRYFWFEPN